MRQCYCRTGLLFAKPKYRRTTRISSACRFCRNGCVRNHYRRPSCAARQIFRRRRQSKRNRRGSENTQRQCGAGKPPTYACANAQFRKLMRLPRGGSHRGNFRYFRPTRSFARREITSGTGTTQPSSRAPRAS